MPLWALDATPRCPTSRRGRGAAQAKMRWFPDVGEDRCETTPLSADGLMCLALRLQRRLCWTVSAGFTQDPLWLCHFRRCCQ